MVTVGRREVTWTRWIWPMTIAVSSVLALVLLRAQTPVRPVLMMWFLVVCPGMAWARVFGFRDRAMRWTVAVAVSLSVEVLLALGMVYSGLWSVPAAVAVLAFVAIAGAIVDAFRAATYAGDPNGVNTEAS